MNGSPIVEVGLIFRSSEHRISFFLCMIIQGAAVPGICCPSCICNLQNSRDSSLGTFRCSVYVPTDIVRLDQLYLFTVEFVWKWSK